jgi:uncharacterized protein YqcC (DUF446 family)
MESSSQYERAAEAIQQIETELKKIGWWREDSLPEAAFRFEKAFARDTMTFSQWLQFILIPRVRGIIENQGEFPGQSQVGTQAIREFDGCAEASDLVDLLCRFDQIF